MQPPKTVLKKLKSTFARFLWDSKDQAHRMHWRRWKDICLPTNEGGLGFRRLEDVEHPSHSGPHTTFCFCILEEAEGGGTHSGAPTLRGSWVREHTSVQVVEFFDDTGWDIDRLLLVLPHYMVVQVESLPLRLLIDLCGRTPRMVGFLPSSAWQLVCTGSTFHAYCHMIWWPIIPQTISFFCWRLWQGFMPMDVIIQKKIRAHMASRCQCCSEIETIQHVFIDSPVAHQVWQYFSASFGIPLKVGEMLQHRFKTWRFSGQFVNGGHIRIIIPLLVL
ncbi:Retrotransposon [Abeliophyllum distichum]|uniref:Retrotransposon n=1 Tax=Abeliophyllum distichum TaxID=126358 RepID=A0ABD1V9S1_9LAMI